MPSPRGRFGIIVPIKPFGGAVKRNYARRRLREFYRRNRSLFPDGYDVLIRLFIAPPDWNAFLGEIERLLGRINKQVNETSGHERA